MKTFQIGDVVNYESFPGAGKERGIVTSFCDNENFIFKKYDRKGCKKLFLSNNKKMLSYFEANPWKRICSGIGKIITIFSEKC